MAWAKKQGAKVAPKAWQCNCPGKPYVPAIIAYCKRCESSRDK